MSWRVLFGRTTSAGSSLACSVCCKRGPSNLFEMELSQHSLSTHQNRQNLYTPYQFSSPVLQSNQSRENSEKGEVIDHPSSVVSLSWFLSILSSSELSHRSLPLNWQLHANSRVLLQLTRAEATFLNSRIYSCLPRLLPNLKSITSTMRSMFCSQTSSLGADGSALDQSR
jgi:hypothetical protein